VALRMRPKFGPTIVKFGLQVMTPVLVPLFWIMDKAYKVCFGRAELRMSKEAEEKLGHEVLSDLPFLFDDYGGRLCSDETVKHPRPFDYAVVLVALDSLSLRFIRGRGEFQVQMAARQTPEAWEDLATTLAIVDERFESRFFSSVTDVAAALEPRMPRLQGALSADQYPELQKKLANARNYDRAVIRQWETEINRRLFPDR